MIISLLIVRGAILYILKDSIGIFKTMDNRLRIIKYFEGKIIIVNYSKGLVELLLAIKTKKSLDELSSIFNKMSKVEIENILEKLIELNVVEYSKDIRKREINCLIIGCGTTGSHIYSKLSMINIDKIVLIDGDIVDDDNVNRQDFYTEDIGKFKVDVLRNRSKRVKNVIGIKNYVTNSEYLINVCKKNNINLIIQSADKPKTKEICRIVEKTADILNIPYIINFGYISNVMSMPEFYFPNEDYRFSYERDKFQNDNIIFLNVNKKLGYNNASMLGSFVCKQVLDYINNDVPLGYKKRGYFNEIKFKWEYEEF